MKRVAELDETQHFVACGHIGRTTMVLRVVGHDAQWVTVQSCQAGDPRTTVEWCDLEEGSLINYRVDHLFRIVNLSGIARNDGEQALVPSPGVIIGLDAGWHFPDIGWQVREELPDLRKGMFFILGQVVDGAAFANVDFVAAQVFLGDVISQSRFDDRWTAWEKLAVVFRHEAEVGKAGVDGR